jgi:FdhD protein
LRGSLIIPTVRSAYDGSMGIADERLIPIETPIAIEINGVAYAVMMATPCDLEDFVTGFVLSEGLADAHEIGDIQVHPVVQGAGIVVRLNLPPERAAPLMERARRRLGDSSCGLCGIESIETVLRPLPPLDVGSTADAAAIRRGLLAMRERQSLGQTTAATHAAAFFENDGALVGLREDVGRHNALDKLIGALARNDVDPVTGFMVVTSRCSYELVEKAVRAGCPLLVAISAPTDLAVSRAKAAGLALAVVARDDSMLWVAGPHLREPVATDCVTLQ